MLLNIHMSTAIALQQAELATAQAQQLKRTTTELTQTLQTLQKMQSQRQMD